MDFPATPRVHAALLAANTGRVVRIIGAPLGPPARGEISIKAADGQNVRILLQQCEAADYSAKCLEFLGKVNSDLSVSAFRATSFGNDFDLNLHNDLITIENGVLQDVLFV